MQRIVRIIRLLGLSIFWSINVILGLIATCSSDEVSALIPVGAGAILILEYFVYRLYKRWTRRRRTFYLGQGITLSRRRSA